MFDLFCKSLLLFCCISDYSRLNFDSEYDRTVAVMKGFFESPNWSSEQSRFFYQMSKCFGFSALDYFAERQKSILEWVFD